MYITGSQYDFASRLHQLVGMSQPTDATFFSSVMTDFNNFMAEGRVYLGAGTVTVQESGHWEQEARKQRYILSGDANQMLVQQF